MRACTRLRCSAMFLSRQLQAIHTCSPLRRIRFCGWSCTRPSSIRKHCSEPAQGAENSLSAANMLAHGWSGFFAGEGRVLLEASLPAWLPQQRWFGAKARTIKSARVYDWVELSSAAEDCERAHSGGAHGRSPYPFVLVYCQVEYADGPPTCIRSRWPSLPELPARKLAQLILPAAWPSSILPPAARFFTMLRIA